MKLFANLFTAFKKNRKIENVSEYETNKLNILSKKLKLQFNNPILFAKALTHRSYLERTTELNKSNERLEFLGDAVLGMIVAEILFTKFKDEDEGFLTKTRSHIVDRNALYDSAERLQLKKYLLYDSRFIKDSEVGIKTILADCLEALIGAIYLDQGIDAAEKFIIKWLVKPNLESGNYQVDNNFKGQLLEYTHSIKLSSPEYVIVSSKGPDHNKEFIIEVHIDKITHGIGRGRNKKGAEQEAAKNTLLEFKDNSK
ncbi:MAG: ribonuclease III [Melioribacteraceae bacterium]|nr:ribonuclease III [Melioribacteraceae bacterium]